MKDNIENNNNLATILPSCKDITIPKTVSIMKKSIDKRTRYGKLWGMTREATLLALDSDDHEMEHLLQDYIN
ncbi:14713_t:CDS:2 [Funneliformis mosseae]|uniref:14713_t:CDS:1 n=1 Tax=Funneliformis mosseae TaxID=27381 RepID=A0A9N9G841_FUNMO|nr:14713_t:CDS:2 [Funneliformis mosseae]